ncbi:MAG: hypothetical protein U0359_00030 [Byssovorax sp.]
MRVVLPIAAILIGIGVAAALVAPSAPAPAVPAPGEGPGTGVSDGGSIVDEKGPSRCPEKIRERLIVRGPAGALFDGTIAEAVTRLPTFTVRSGRHAGDTAISLGALLAQRPGARAVEVLPCTGDAKTFDRAAISADPERYFLVSAKRAALKLMDRDGDGRKPVMKNLAEIRILD